MSKKIEICAIIPARSGSKQIKDKNILKFNGKPSLYYSIKASFKSSLISKVLFSSDSKKYLNIAKKYKPDFLHLRSKKNSRSNSTDLDFLKEIYHYLDDKYNYRPDVFALLRANNPTKSLRDINSAINAFSKNFKKYSSLRSVNLMSETSYKTFYTKKNALFGVMTNSSKVDNLNLPKEKFRNTYSGNGCIDLIKTNNIKNGILHGNKCYAYVTQDVCVDIDYKNDVDYAKFILKNKKKNYIK
jgi:CMP-N,N'-diacetyllegionaminic acid synthase